MHHKVAPPYNEVSTSRHSIGAVARAESAPHEEEPAMTRLHKRILNATRILGLALLILIVPATRSQAQFYGYPGYGYPGYGYGGYGYPGYGYGGYGYPGYGYGYGGYGMPGFGYVAPGVGLGSGTGLAPANYYGFG